jgi:hypothetical protein
MYLQAYPVYSMEVASTFQEVLHECLGSQISRDLWAVMSNLVQRVSQFSKPYR